MMMDLIKFISTFSATPGASWVVSGDNINDMHAAAQGKDTRREEEGVNTVSSPLT